MSEDDLEVVECARYNEFDDLKELLEVKQADIDATDANGSTALHMAAGNGHLDIVKYLADKGAKYKPNGSRNYPLHWAVQNKHVAVVEYIVNHPLYTESLDVFAMNEFGVSAVTNGFNNSCSEAVVALLKHPSAEKKKNLDTVGEGAEGTEAGVKSVGSEAKEQPGSSTNKSKKKNKKKKKNALPEDLVQVTHEFCLSPANKEEVVFAREVSSLSLQWGAKVFDKVAADDTTGICVWAASVLLSRWIVEQSSAFAGKTVLELGAGCGLPGLVCRRYTEAKHITLTDLYKLTLLNLQYNVDKNFQQPENVPENATEEKKDCEQQEERPMFSTTDTTHFYSHKFSEAEVKRGVSVRALDWSNVGTWPKEKVDAIVGSDLVYQKEAVPMFVKVLSSLLKPSGTIFYCARKERDGLDTFVTQMTKGGFVLSLARCGANYFSNPLHSADQEECDRYFELNPEHNYHFYKFVRTAEPAEPEPDSNEMAATGKKAGAKSATGKSAKSKK